jgi:hypothetical protein
MSNYKANHYKANHFKAIMSNYKANHFKAISGWQLIIGWTKWWSAVILKRGLIHPMDTHKSTSTN